MMDFKMPMKKAGFMEDSFMPFYEPDAKINVGSFTSPN